MPFRLLAIKSNYYLRLLLSLTIVSFFVVVVVVAANNRKKKQQPLENSAHFDVVIFCFIDMLQHCSTARALRRMNGQRNALNTKIITSLAVKLARFC